MILSEIKTFNFKLRMVLRKLLSWKRGVSSCFEMKLIKIRVKGHKLVLKTKVVRNLRQLKGRPRSSHPIMNVLKLIRIRFLALKLYGFMHYPDTLNLYLKFVLS